MALVLKAGPRQGEDEGPGGWGRGFQTRSMLFSKGGGAQTGLNRSYSSDQDSREMQREGRASLTRSQAQRRDPLLKATGFQFWAQKSHQTTSSPALLPGVKTPAPCFAPLPSSRT